MNSRMFGVKRKAHLDFLDPSKYFLLGSHTPGASTMEVYAHILVEGLVQGVGFRWFVARHAQSLGLHGYVKNLYDGNVEIVAEGDRSLVEELIKHVKVGPRSAHVTNLRLAWAEPTRQFRHFEIR